MLKTKRKNKQTPLQKLLGATSGDYTSVASIQKVSRQQQAMQKRIDGVGYSVIARQLGYLTPKEAFEDVVSGLRDSIRETGEDLRSVELDRLDWLYSKLVKQAERGDVHAIKAALEISKHRAKLVGLDKPQDHTILSAEMKKLAEMMGVSVEEIADQMALLTRKHRISNIHVGELPEPIVVSATIKNKAERISDSRDRRRSRKEER